MGYQIAPLFHLSAALHTNTEMRIMAKVYFDSPHPCTIHITSFSSSRLLADSRAGNLRSRGRSVCTLLRLSILWKLRKVKYTQAFRLLLLIGNVIKTDSKTKPTSKLHCRVIVFIYKLRRVQKETSSWTASSYEWTWRKHTGSISFSLPHINKKHWFLFFILVIIKICS